VAKRDAGRESRIKGYFRKTWAEIRKVRWPSRKEAMNLTGIVLAVTIVMSAFLGLLDYGFSWLFRLIVG
jgi:preprotein translocase subunit SecE